MKPFHDDDLNEDIICMRLSNKLNIRYSVVKKAFNEMKREDVQQCTAKAGEEG